jgi:hypothetical protein
LETDVFTSIYNPGKVTLLTSLRDRRSAEQFDWRTLATMGTVRHRVVGIVRDYGMFDRRESPQYYPEIPTPH